MGYMVLISKSQLFVQRMSMAVTLNDKWKSQLYEFGPSHISPSPALKHTTTVG